jgi:HEAT repeat protein
LAGLALGLILACGLTACGRPEKTPSWPPTNEIVEAMICNLHSSDPTVRCCAATALGVLGPKAEAAVPDLEIALHDNVQSVRDAARKALVLITSPVSERHQRGAVRS